MLHMKTKSAISKAVLVSKKDFESVKSSSALSIAEMMTEQFAGAEKEEADKVGHIDCTVIPILKGDFAIDTILRLKAVPRVRITDKSYYSLQRFNRYSKYSSDSHSWYRLQMWYRLKSTLQLLSPHLP